MSEAFVSEATYENARRAVAVLDEDQRLGLALLLIANGTDVKTVQGRLGHSSADITMNIYAHALPRNDATAAQAIDGMLGGVA